MITAEELLRASRPFRYSIADRPKPENRPCATPGCGGVRHVTESGLVKTYCAPCCREADRKWRESKRRQR